MSADSIPIDSGKTNNLLKRIEEKGRYDECGTYHKIVWPVTPKDRLSAIHYAQMRAIAEVYKEGDIHIVRSEIVCNSNSDQFINALKKGLNNLNIYNIQESKDGFSNIKKENLNKILCKLNIEEMVNFRNKNYAGRPKNGNVQKDEKIQKYIAPIYQLLTVANIVDATDKDALLIAGKDEEEQWDKLSKLYRDGDIRSSNSGTPHEIRLLLIPELKTDDDATIDQNEEEMKEILTCKNKSKLMEFLKNNKNGREWFETMFLDDRSLIGKNEGIDEIIRKIDEIKKGI